MVLNPGSIWISVNYGVDWSEVSDQTITNKAWTDVCISDDGARIMTCNFNGQIYSSEDTGTTWTLEAVTGNAWTSIDMNSDASIVTAVGENSLIYVRA